MIHSHTACNFLHRANVRCATITALVFTLVTPNLNAQESPPSPPKFTPLPHPDLPKPIITELGLPLWLIITGVVIALLLVATVIWLLLHRGKAPIAPPALPLTRANQRLKELLAECQSLPPDEIGHRVSVIVRDYQAVCYAVPARYRTREELYENDKMPNSEMPHARFEPLAELCDRLAFAPAPSTTEQAETLIHSALDALDQESMPTNITAAT